MVLLTVRQHEGKSYRMFAEWLVEAYYLRMFLQLSHIPHYGQSSYNELFLYLSKLRGLLNEFMIQPTKIPVLSSSLNYIAPHEYT